MISLPTSETPDVQDTSHPIAGPTPHSASLASDHHPSLELFRQREIMPPTRTTRSSAAPKLKQAKLSFNATKRGASANTAKPAKASVARTSSTPVLSRRADSSSSSISADSSSSDHTDDDDDIEVVEAPRKSTRRPPPAKAVINVDAEVEHLDVKDRRWDRAHKEAKELRGTPLVHAEGQNKVHDILRVFDMYVCAVVSVLKHPLTNLPLLS